MDHTIHVRAEAVPKRAAHTRLAFDRLQHARAMLENTFAALRDKTADVALPPGPANATDTNCEPIPMRSPLANSLHEEANLLEQLNGQMLELIDRLDL